MKVFKFGGASVKDSKSIKNITRILKITGYNDTIIVISAMGKTTNALEFLVKDYIPVIALPNINECISNVPSYVFTASKFITCLII